MSYLNFFVMEGVTGWHVKASHFTGTLVPERAWQSCQGMELLDDCEFIAIFDADFKPELEFLVRCMRQA